MSAVNPQGCSCSGTSLSRSNVHSFALPLPLTLPLLPVFLGSNSSHAESVGKQAMRFCSMLLYSARGQEPRFRYLLQSPHLCGSAGFASVLSMQKKLFCFCWRNSRRVKLLPSFVVRAAVQVFQQCRRLEGCKTAWQTWDTSCSRRRCRYTANCSF